MEKHDEMRAFLADHFGALGTITCRAMMGGLCIYADGQIFGIVGDADQIYLRAKGQLAEDLAAEGSTQFTFAKKDGQPAHMGYWTLPDPALDDPEIACQWAERALREGDGR